MNDRDITKSERGGLFFAGILSLIVGLIFFLPGAMFSSGAFFKVFYAKEPLDIAFVFIATFPLTVGTILIFVAFQFFTGRILNQSISRPVLLILSLFFIGLGSLFVVLGWVMGAMPTGYTFGRGVGGSFVLGFFSLWLFRKKGQKTPNHLIEVDKKSADG